MSPSTNAARRLWVAIALFGVAAGLAWWGLAIRLPNALRGVSTSSASACTEVWFTRTGEVAISGELTYAFCGVSFSTMPRLPLYEPPTNLTTAPGERGGGSVIALKRRKRHDSAEGK